MTKKPENDNLRTSTNKEHLHRVSSFLLKASAGILAPAGGGVLSAMFDLVVSDPAIRRRDKFLVAVDKRLTAMEQAGLLHARDLEDNEEISALLLRATQAATRSSGERKLSALKEIVVKGVTAKEAAGASYAQVMLALVDRMTEHHIIALHWMKVPKRLYTLGQIRDNPQPGMRESLFYGQPVYTDKSSLVNPSAIWSYDSEFSLYVEHSEQVAFHIAEADLSALGLVEPVYRLKEVKEGWKSFREPSSEIVGHKVSSLGEHLLDYIASKEPLAEDVPPGPTATD